MAKSVEEISKALKLKAQPKSEVLSIKLGPKKHSLPFESRTLSSEKYVFIHIPPAANIFRISPEGLTVVDDPEEARTAQLSFRAARKKGETKRKTSVELPDELKSALSKIPAGYRLGIGPDGSPRLVKTRVRRK